MARFLHIFLTVLILLFLAGCGQTEAAVSAPPAAMEAPSLKEISPIEETECPAAGDILALAAQDLDVDLQSVEYVLSDDGTENLAGIIAYLNGDNTVQLAFVEWDGCCHPVGIAASGRYMLCGGTLSYLGGGAVSLSLSEDSTGQILDYTVEFSKIEEGTGSNYTISAQERA